MESVYIMVTGPAASGKSTLCSKMCIELPAFFYKPANAYFELAKKYGIPKERIFYDVNPAEVSKYFCDICKKHDIVVGDQHLAIQHKKDSALALNKIIDIDPNEPFVSAVDYSLFDKMADAHIKTIIVYLKANPEILYERAYRRSIETGAVMRNRCLQEVIDEINAEEYFFQELINIKKIENFIINTDVYNVDKAFHYVKSRILKR